MALRALRHLLGAPSGIGTVVALNGFPVAANRAGGCMGSKGLAELAYRGTLVGYLEPDGAGLPRADLDGFLVIQHRQGLGDAVITPHVFELWNERESLASLPAVLTRFLISASFGEFAPGGSRM